MGLLRNVLFKQINLLINSKDRTYVTTRGIWGFIHLWTVSGNNSKRLIIVNSLTHKILKFSDHKILTQEDNQLLLV